MIFEFRSRLRLHRKILALNRRLYQINLLYSGAINSSYLRVRQRGLECQEIEMWYDKTIKIVESAYPINN